MKIEAIPNLVSPVYSFIAQKSPCIKDIYKEVADEICSKLSSGRILDIGTGPGYLPIEIARRSSAFEIVGIDLSPRMVEIANNNAQGAGLSGRIKFKLANAGSLPFEDGYFDLIVSTLSLHHWSDPARCINEIYRVLKKNGEAYIYDLRRDTPEEVNASFRTRYGWFLSFLFLKIVRLHSSITLKEAEKLLSSHKAGFSKQDIQEKEILLGLHMLK